MVKSKGKREEMERDGVSLECMYYVLFNKIQI